MQEKMYNVRDAAKWLGFSEDWIHKLVRRGELPARVFVDGKLVKYVPDGPRRGQGVYFLAEDLKAFRATPRKKVGRQPGSKVVKSGT